MKLKLTPRITKKLVILAIAGAPTAAVAWWVIYTLLEQTGNPPSTGLTVTWWAVCGCLGYTLAIWVAKNHQEQ